MLTLATGGLKKSLAHPMLFDAYQTLIGEPNCHAYFIREMLQPRPGERVLDIGCGVGASLRYIPDGVRYVGIDNSEAYIRRARMSLGHRGKFACVDLGSADADDLGKFDRAFAYGVLHHLSDDLAHRLMELAQRVLHPGGRLATLDPCYVPGQSRIARWLIDNDRGLYVRDVAGFKVIFSELGEIETYVRHDLLRVPFTQLICRVDMPRSSPKSETVLPE